MVALQPLYVVVVVLSSDGWVKIKVKLTTLPPQVVHVYRFFTGRYSASTLFFILRISRYDARLFLEDWPTSIKKKIAWKAPIDVGSYE